MSGRVILRAGTLIVMVPAVGWLVVQIVSGFQTIRQMNGQMQECATGAVHCADIFYYQVVEKTGQIHMFQGFFAFCAVVLGLAAALILISTSKRNWNSATSTV